MFFPYVYKTPRAFNAKELQNSWPNWAQNSEEYEGCYGFVLDDLGIFRILNAQIFSHTSPGILPRNTDLCLKYPKWEIFAKGTIGMPLEGYG